MNTKFPKDVTERQLIEAGLFYPVGKAVVLNGCSILNNLFDKGQYVVNMVSSCYIAVGFIDGVPAKCEYEPNLNHLIIKALTKKRICNYYTWKKAIPQRLSNSKTTLKLSNYGRGHWFARFYKRPGKATETKY